MISPSNRVFAVELIQNSNQNGARLVKACEEIHISVRTYERWVVDGDVKVDQRKVYTIDSIEFSIYLVEKQLAGKFGKQKRQNIQNVGQEAQKIGHRMKRPHRIAGLNEDLTPHSLRHTHTSLLAKARVSLEQIMDRLGHTDNQITKNVYLHVTQKMKKKRPKSSMNL